MSIETEKLKNILEAALLAHGQPLSLDKLASLFAEEEQVSRQEIRDALQQLQQDCVNRSVELVEVGSGYRYQARKDYGQWVSRLWEEKPPRYSRALLETLALVAYRQPITRAEVEDIRGVTVSSHIMKTLQERDWVRVVGHKDVPGKPALYATTKAFLDYFNLKSLDELPSLMEIRDLDKINAELDAQAGSEQAQVTETVSEHNEAQAMVDEPDERLLPDGEGDHGDGLDEEEGGTTLVAEGDASASELGENISEKSVEDQASEYVEASEIAILGTGEPGDDAPARDLNPQENDLEITVQSVDDAARNEGDEAQSVTDYQPEDGDTVVKSGDESYGHSEYDNPDYSDTGYVESASIASAQMESVPIESAPMESVPIESGDGENNAAESETAASTDMDSEPFESKTSDADNISAVDNESDIKDFDHRGTVSRDSKREVRNFDANSDDESEYSDEEHAEESLSAAEPNG